MRTLVSFLLLILLPIACAKPDEQTRQRKLSQRKALQLPTAKRFAIGDSFTYSNPTTTWRITQIQGDRLGWQSNLGERMVTSSNPFLPAWRWQSPRYGQGTRNISQQKGSLFPLRQGRHIRFNAQTATKKQSQNFTWNCVVGDRQKTTVPAGTFKTFEVLCQRKNADALIYRYAPAIARIVEFRTPGFGLGRATRRQLIAYNSLAGAAYQESQDDLGISPTLEPLSIPSEEETTPPYQPSLPPIAPLPFAPPSDFFAPQQDSAPSPNPRNEQPATEPLKRLLEEALEEQRNRTPVLPQFQENSPRVVPPQAEPLSEPEPELQPEPEPQPESLPEVQPQPESQPESQPEPSSESSPESQQSEPPEASVPAPQNTTSAVLIGSYPSLSQARQAWQRISKHRNLVNGFAGRRYDILRQNDSTRGILYALYAHPYINGAAAQEVCDAVRKAFRRNACRITAWKKR